MVDKNSIPYLSVILTKRDTNVYPIYELPEGYSFCEYEDELQIEWIKLNMMYDVFESFGQAISYFQNAFLGNRDLLRKQMLFVKNSENQVVATACLWEGSHFGQPVQRIHFFAVHNFHRSKGIGKAMISRLLAVYNEQQYKTGIYITSQTWSYKEINLFFMFGFKEYMGAMPPRWKGTPAQFNTNKPIAWKIIKEHIGSRLHEAAPEPPPPETPVI